MRTITNWWVKAILLIGILLITACSDDTLSKEYITSLYPEELLHRWHIKSVEINYTDVSNQYLNASIRLFDNGYVVFRKNKIDEAGTWYKDEISQHLIFNFEGRQELNTAWEITHKRNKRMTISKRFPYTQATIVLKYNN